MACGRRHRRQGVRQAGNVRRESWGKGDGKGVGAKDMCWCLGRLCAKCGARRVEALANDTVWVGMPACNAAGHAGGERAVGQERPWDRVAFGEGRIPTSINKSRKKNAKAERICTGVVWHVWREAQGWGEAAAVAAKAPPAIVACVVTESVENKPARLDGRAGLDVWRNERSQVSIQVKAPRWLGPRATKLLRLATAMVPGADAPRPIQAGARQRRRCLRRRRCMRANALGRREGEGPAECGCCTSAKRLGSSEEVGRSVT